MKKGMKRIIALLVLAAMIVCVAQNVFAANESTCKYYKLFGKHDYRIQGDAERKYKRSDANKHYFDVIVHEKCNSCGDKHDITTEESGPHDCFDEYEPTFVWQTTNTEHWKYWTQDTRCRVCYQRYQRHYTNTRYRHSYWCTGTKTINGVKYNVKYCDCGKYMITGKAK